LCAIAAKDLPLDRFEPLQRVDHARAEQDALDDLGIDDDFACGHAMQGINEAISILDSVLNGSLLATAGGRGRSAVPP
jgi:hypothetical protein